MRNSNYTTYIGYASLTVGNAYLLKNDFEQAEIYLEAALEADKKYSVAKLPGSNLSLAKLYQRLNNLGKAIHFANNALYYSRKAKDVKCQTESYSMLYTIYNSQNRNDSAFHFLQLYKTLSDSLNRVERDKIYEYLNLGFNEQVKQQGIEQARTQKANYIRLYTILLALGVMVFISFLLFRNNRNRKKANTILQQQKERVETTLSKLKTTQSQLIQSEKMASLGELTAGIAHEIQNPLNFVNNFSEVNTELIGELEQEVSKGNLAEVKAIVKNIKDNEQKINHHGKRAGDIVKGMLQHSRTSSGQKELTDINLLCDEYLRLAYHGLKAKDKSFNAKFETELDASLPKMNVVPQDIGRVILNLITNAFYAVNERLRQAPPDSHYEPTVSVSTKKSGDKILVSVKDNGNGIPQKVLDKIFQPFFTTKPTGQGTGLGLSLSYDIVKAHGGEIKVNTNENEGTEFTIKLPA
jgi:two-component system NtrC family sensor kinase